MTYENWPDEGWKAQLNEIAERLEGVEERLEGVEWDAAHRREVVSQHRKERQDDLESRLKEVTIRLQGLERDTNSRINDLDRRTPQALSQIIQERTDKQFSKIARQDQTIAKLNQRLQALESSARKKSVEVLDGDSPGRCTEALYIGGVEHRCIYYHHEERAKRAHFVWLKDKDSIREVRW